MRPLAAEGRERPEADAVRRLSAEVDELFRCLGLDIDAEGR
jgi:hypothetical protein